MPVTLKKVDSVPPGYGIGNVDYLLSDNDMERAYGMMTWISWWGIPLPYGLVFDLGKPRVIGRVDLRNGMAKGWASGTKGGNSIAFLMARVWA